MPLAQVKKCSRVYRLWRMAEYSRERRALLAAHGLCQCCGKEDAEAGYTQCRSCHIYNNQRRSGAQNAPLSPYKNGRRMR